MDSLAFDRNYPLNDLISDIKAGNRRALSKAISMAESSLDLDRKATEDVLEALLPYTGNAKGLASRVARALVNPLLSNHSVWHV